MSPLDTEMPRPLKSVRKTTHLHSGTELVTENYPNVPAIRFVTH